MKHGLHILFVALATLAAPPADAEPRERAAEAILAGHGLGEGIACLHFIERASVERRTAIWRAAIDEIASADRDYLLAWLVGAAEPPEGAMREASRQRDCMIDRITHDAGEREQTLAIDWQRERARPEQMPSLRRKFETDPRFARKLVDLLTESTYRSAHTQSWIWKRKFVFSGRNFNFVSAGAARACGLTQYESWKPDDSRHRSCWRDVLTPAEREREILQASAAPGISRHHWGSDFDFFGLNPASFLDGARLGDEYEWMTANALEFGFFQPYQQHRQPHRYMEERWHWSYHPVAGALLGWAADHEDEVEAALEAQWADFERRWGAGETPFFSHVRSHWRSFMFGIAGLDGVTR